MYGMDDLIVKRLCEVGLGDEDPGCLMLEDSDIDEGLKEDALSVLVHIHGGKSIHLDGFKSAMGNDGFCVVWWPLEF